MAPSHARRLVCSLARAAVFLFVASLALHAQEGPPPDPTWSTSALQEFTSSPPVWRDVSGSLLPANFLRDQEDIWLFPRQLAQGEHWSATVTVVAATIGLVSADPHVTPYFCHTTAFRGFDRVFSSNLTGAETIAIPTALYLIGRDRRDSYMEKTALFAGEAVADSEVVRAVMNSVTNRWRPQDIFTRRSYSNTFFHDSSHVGSSFPSGHTIAAVSVATVIARRYRNHRWVPWVAYGLAGTIGFSRISLRAHFPSDVFLGAVLGYSIARYDVLQNH